MHNPNCKISRCTKKHRLISFKQKHISLAKTSKQKKHLQTPFGT